MPLAGEAVVTDVQSLGPPHGLEIENTDDVVQTFTGITSGQWTARAHVFVPMDYSGTGGFVMLNEYNIPDGEPKNWSTQIILDGDLDEVRSDFEGATLPLRRGEWVEIRVEIDLDQDFQEIYYGADYLTGKSWTEGVSGGGALNIAALNVYANPGATPVYWDNVSLCSGAIVNVDQGVAYRTIQVAIGEASDGDVITVQPGAYQERLDFEGRNVLVQGTDSDPANTIIYNAVGPVVTFATGETSAAELRLFTIQGGTTTGDGGGVLISSSGPTMRSCLVRGCQAARGGGIAALFAAPDILDVGFMDNTATGEGGGLFLLASTARVDFCGFFRNAANGGGGGNFGDSDVSMSLARFIDNTANFDGSGLLSYGSTVSIDTSLFTGNVGKGSGGAALSNLFDSTMAVTNCTFTANTGNNEGALGVFQSDTTVTNCIFWNDSPREIAHFDSGTTTVSFSNVQGGWTGPGTDNINADPVFNSPNDQHLTEASPCINAGDDAAPILNTIDFDGNPRIRECRVDMGMYETPFIGEDCNEDGRSDACNIELDADLVDDGRGEGLVGNGPILTFGVSYLAGGGQKKEDGPTTDIVGAIAIAWPDDGFGFAIGDPVTVYLWDDPNDDLVPDDAVLLASAEGTVGTLNDAFDEIDETFDVYPIDETEVSGVYFVGVSVTTGGGQITFDVTDPQAGRNWARAGLLGTTGIRDSTLIEDQCCAGNFMVRPRRASDQDGNGLPDACDANVIFGPPREFGAVGEATIQAVGNADTGGVGAGAVTTDVVVLIPDENPAMPGRAQVFLNLAGDGELTPREPIDTGRDPSGVAVGFFDGDAFQDFVVTNANDGTVTLYLNDGSGQGTYELPVTIAKGNDPRAVATADFNGDGADDLGIVFAGTNELRILFGHRDGTFDVGPMIGGGVGMVRIETGDLDNDKDLDMVDAVTGGDSVGISFLVAGTFEERVELPVGALPVDIAIGDFDLDGNLDIASANNGDGTVSVLLNRGGRVFDPAFRVPVGENPLSVEAADLDGDGDLDLAVIATDALVGRAVQVLQNNTFSPADGGSLFAPAMTFAIDAEPNFVANGDFNGDGRADLITANNEPGGEGSVTVLITLDPACAGDVDGNFSVDFQDVLAILSAWGMCPGCDEDLDDNGIVSFADLVILLGNWGPC